MGRIQLFINWWINKQNFCLFCLLNCSVMCDSLWLHGLPPTRLLCPYNLPGKNTGVGCCFLLLRALSCLSPASLGLLQFCHILHLLGAYCVWATGHLIPHNSVWRRQYYCTLLACTARLGDFYILTKSHGHQAEE